MFRLYFNVDALRNTYIKSCVKKQHHIYEFIQSLSISFSEKNKLLKNHADSSKLPGLFEIILVIKQSAQSDCKTYLLSQNNILIGHRLIYKILLQNDKHLLVGHCSLVSQALSLNNSFLFVSQLNLVGKTHSRNDKIPTAWLL